MTAPRDSRAERRDLWLVLSAGLLARALPLWLAVEHYGDAPVRIETAERWLSSPHLWRGFAEAFQYGPLHLTLLAGSVGLFGRFAGPKLLSLAFGLLGLWLLHRVARRVASPKAALCAGLCLALSPLHIQASTTGASEAVFLALLLGAIDLLLSARDQPRSAGRLAASALLVGLASLVRYDGFFYLGLLAVLLLADRRARAAIGWAALAALLPALWFLQCWRVNGDPLSTLHHINADHRYLAEGAIKYLGSLRYRLYCLGYWPAAVLLVCTPLAGALALLGAARMLASIRRRRLSGAQVLALLAWLPAAVLTFRGAVLADFRPMARFALVAGALSLPLAWDAVEWLAALAGPALRRPLLALAGAVLLLWPTGLALASFGRDGNLAEWARPLSPISTTPPGVTQAARWLRAHAGPGDLVLLDHTWHYLDIPLAFESALGEERLARSAWPDFEQKLARKAPTLAVLLDDGELKRQGAAVGSPRFSFRGTAFCAAEHFVYASVYRRCP